MVNVMVLTRATPRAGALMTIDRLNIPYECSKGAVHASLLLASEGRKLIVFPLFIDIAFQL